MKTRFFTLVIALAGLFTFSSSFQSVYSQIGVPVTGSNGTCTFTGIAQLALSDDGQTVLATGTLSGVITNTDDNGTPLDPSDDPADEVITNQPIFEAVNLNGTTCTSLSVNSNDGLNVISNCGTVPLSFGSVSYASKPGGRLNLITNSLCAIARYYDNGQKASINSLFAHVANFMRAITR